MKRAWGVILSLVTSIAAAQPYPVKPIRVITAEPGGGNDFIARALGQAVAPRLGQSWVVDNRGGAGGLIAFELAARAPADGYTILVYAGNIWTIPLLTKKARYAMTDFAPITWAARSPNSVVVHPSLPVTNVQELIALARAKPGQLNYGSGGNGSSTHLAVELFKSMAKVDIVRVPYKGNGPALNDLVGGRLQLMISTAGSVATHVKSGRLRAIAVTSTEPSPLAPGLPTVASSGLPGYESISIYGVYAPAKTPAAIIKQLNEVMVAALQTQELRERLLAVGVEAVGSTPQEFAAAIKSDTARLAKVIRDAGIKEE
jgi:tripartite-type tricarboxylate transporter receptor subunit TctC